MGAVRRGCVSQYPLGHAGGYAVPHGRGRFGAMNLLEVRGAFWWHDEPIPEGCPAPTSCVTGQLIVDDYGLSRLELDGILSQSFQSSPKPLGFDPMPEGIAIRGLVKGKNQHVLLSSLRRSAVAYGSMSYEKFLAQNCIIGVKPFPAGDTFSQVRSLEIDLTGFEEWIGLRSITFTSQLDKVAATYDKPEDLVFPLPDGELRIIYHLNRPSSISGRTHSLALTEFATLDYRFSAPALLEDAKTQYRMIEEWLILITNSEHGLGWPDITVEGQDIRYSLFFWRQRNSASAPSMVECYPPFALVRERLGRLFAAWKEKRNTYGSAFALYVASRRGFRLYTENRFINFIWAIESFHRTKYPQTTQPTSLDKKVERILGQISEKKDRDWLKSRLSYSEIDLKQRITQVILSLPLQITRSKCDQFAEDCSRRRNDLSHYGGRRHNTGTYEEFHEDISRKSDALSYLLHLIILQELGIEADILSGLLFKSYYSYPIKQAFVDVGLLDRSVLKPAGPTPH